MKIMNDTAASLGTASEIKFREVPTENILGNPRGNPRKNIRQRDIDRLCESIIACGGILVPLVVFQGPTNDTYYLLDGERRLIAAKKLGLKKVPVNILPRPLPDDKNLETMFTIHMARIPWNTMARAMALNEYLKLRPELEKNARLLRQITGMSPYEIKNALLVRMFPEAVQLRAVYPEKSGGLQPSYLIELAKVINKAEDLELLDKNLRHKVIETFLRKIESKVIYDPYQLKDLQTILGNTPKKEAKEVFQNLVDNPNYRIDSIVLSYADKIKGLRSFHARATERSIGDALIQTKTQWNTLLVSLAVLKGVKLSQGDLDEIKKLFRQTRSALKAIL